MTISSAVQPIELAIGASSLRDTALAQGTIALGELGLGGEIRPPAQLEARLKEARQMGFKRALVGRTPKPVKVEGLEVVVCEDLGVALERGLG